MGSCQVCIQRGRALKKNRGLRRRMGKGGGERKEEGYCKRGPPTFPGKMGRKVKRRKGGTDKHYYRVEKGGKWRKNNYKGFRPSGKKTME